eukprot:913844-Prymnesium_polylepis.1
MRACVADIEEVTVHTWVAGLDVRVVAAVVCRARACAAGGCAVRCASPAVAGAAGGPSCGRPAILE